MNGHPTDDQLLDLAAGFGPGAERTTLEEHLAECEPCDERFRLAVSERMRARFAAPGSAAVIPLPRWRRRAIPAFAFAAAAAIALFVLLPRGSDPEPAWLPASGEDVVKRGAGPGASPDWEAGLQAYSRGEVDEAIRRLEIEHPGDRFETMRRIYLASALAHAQRWEDSIRAVEGLPLEAIPEPWGPESRWTLAIALRGAGREDAAEAVLGALAAEPGPVGDRARRLVGSAPALD